MSTVVTDGGGGVHRIAAPDFSLWHGLERTPRPNMNGDMYYKFAWCYFAPYFCCIHAIIAKPQIYSVLAMH